MANNLKQAAQKLKTKGRGSDTDVVHVEKEKRVLGLLGGSGAINPKTGLQEFDVWRIYRR
jgi:hypothetical protein